ncbi:MAG: Bax inhibitor-1/YccA family protein [Candidatus Aceula meridiana]|nr:Bax inhibitor-1/YccA family protein [Candidatus Aceula meridiana]
MRSSNPAMNSAALSKIGRVAESEAMTIQGSVNRTLTLLFLVMMPAYWAWNQVMQSIAYSFNQTGQTSLPSNFYPMAIGFGIGAFILALITIFKKEWSMFTAPLYALCEGFVLGIISAIFELQYPGIVVQAISLTFGTLFALLMIYKTGIIKVTNKFRLGVVAATGGIALIYFLSFVMSFFGARIPLIHEATPLGIGFSLVVIAIAALNLILDFDFIEKGSERGLPRYMEWYAAFGLMVTLIWLYFEILRFLAKIRSRR